MPVQHDETIMNTYTSNIFSSDKHTKYAGVPLTKLHFTSSFHHDNLPATLDVLTFLTSVIIQVFQAFVKSAGNVLLFVGNTPCSEIPMLTNSLNMWSLFRLVGDILF